MSARAVASKKMEISQFLQSWGPLKAKLEELMECELASIGTILQGHVKGETVEELNKHIFQKNAIERVFQLVQELKEDLHPDEESSDSDEK